MARKIRGWIATADGMDGRPDVDGWIVTVDAWVVAAVPGLQAHRHEWLPRRWIVTHRPSGRGLPGSLRTKADALRYIRALAPIADWTRSTDRLWAIPDLPQRVAAAFDGLALEDAKRYRVRPVTEESR